MQKMCCARMGKWGILGYTASGMATVGAGSLISAAGASGLGKKLSETGRCWLLSATTATENPDLARWITQLGRASSVVGEAVGRFFSGWGHCRWCRYRDKCPRLHQE